MAAAAAAAVIDQAAAGAAPPAAPAAAEQEVEVIDILDDEDPVEQAVAGPSGRGGGAGPSQQQRQRQRWRRSGGGGGDVIDLTSESLPEDEIEVLRSTVARVAPRSAKRPRAQQQQAAAGAGPWQHLSPTSKQLLAQLRAAPAAPPPPPPEPEGPKCGICLEVMGGSDGQPMASGPCGHVYCHACLLAAVKSQKKCPTCRKGMQVRSIHKVFVSFS